MDPTWEACKLRPLSFEKLDIVSSYHLQPPEMLKIAQIPNVVDPSQIVPLYDVNLFQRREQAREKLANINYRQLQAFNPFESLGSGPFGDRAAMKLANMDAVFNLTGADTRRGINDPNVERKFTQPSEGPVPGNPAGAPTGPIEAMPLLPNLAGPLRQSLTYVDLAGGPGGWTQYLQLRRPDSFGFGITLESATKGLNWDYKIVDNSRFTPFEGKKGDILEAWQDFIGFVLGPERKKAGVQLAVADGGIGVEELLDDEYRRTGEIKDRQERYRQQEVDNRALIHHEALIALNVLQRGGDFVFKAYDLHTEFARSFIYLLSLNFGELLPFKPASSRLLNTEKFVVCRNFTPNRAVINYMESISPAVKAKQEIPPVQGMSVAYQQWFYSINNLHLKTQVNALETFLAGGKLEPIHASKALLLWGLPSDVLV